MSNPFYIAPSPNGGMSFVQFMNAMRGKNPNVIINEMVSSGRINQQQLNSVQQKAKQMAGVFDGFRSMFGF